MDLPETRYAKTVDGLYIAYQVLGDRPIDLVFSQGWISNVDAAWDVPSYAAGFRRLAKGFRLITFDRRGAGLSDRPPAAEALALEVGMDDIRAVMDAAGSERAVLLGFEDGNMLAALFAASFPERVLALVLHAPWAKGTRTPDYPWGWTDAEWDEWREHVESGWGTIEYARYNTGLGGPSALADRSWPEMFARYLRASASPGAILAIEEMQRDIDVREILPSVRIPTLVMQRTGDLMEPIEQARHMADLIPGAKLVELPGDDHAPLIGDTEGLIGEIERFVGSVRDEEAEFDRVLATVLFTDIVGSTERASAMGDRAYHELLERHHATVRAMLGRYRGREVDTAGDGFFATFDGPARAIRCASSISEAVRPLGLEIRAGLHTGEVEHVGEDVRGIAVHIGARVGALAGPSEVLVSQTVKDLVAGSGLAFEDAGEHELKGVPDRWRLYRVVA